jgi:hypothetical protein
VVSLLEERLMMQFGLKRVFADVIYRQDWVELPGSSPFQIDLMMDLIRLLDGVWVSEQEEKRRRLALLVN